MRRALDQKETWLDWSRMARVPRLGDPAESFRLRGGRRLSGGRVRSGGGQVRARCLHWCRDGSAGARLGPTLAISGSVRCVRAPGSAVLLANRCTLPGGRCRLWSQWLEVIWAAA